MECRVEGGNIKKHVHKICRNSTEGNKKRYNSVNKILEAVEQEEKLCDEEETVIEFTYLGDMVSAVGRGVHLVRV